jgi:hypothetical protein
VCGIFSAAAAFFAASKLASIAVPPCGASAIAGSTPLVSAVGAGCSAGVWVCPACPACPASCLGCRAARASISRARFCHVLAHCPSAAITRPMTLSRHLSGAAVIRNAFSGVTTYVIAELSVISSPTYGVSRASIAGGTAAAAPPLVLVALPGVPAASASPPRTHLPMSPWYASSRS